jgi:organic hydroperoxide reductase OsmC/OhrA
MSGEHSYALSLEWTGNEGAGTSTPRSYGRDHDVRAPDRATIFGSSDPAFRGSSRRWNPEQLLVASLAQCHMLWYLDLASRSGIVVTAYVDEPTGTMIENSDGSGSFAEVTLRPTVTITAEAHVTRARELHAEVGSYCFIARSVKFPVLHEATIRVSAPALTGSAPEKSSRQ